MFPTLTRPLSRREMLQTASCGFGYLALAALASESRAEAPLREKKPHVTPRAKRVIFVFMHGGPSQVDTFDPKPLLEQYDGKPLPIRAAANLSKGTQPNLMKSPW